MSELDLAELVNYLPGIAAQGRPALLPALLHTQALYGYIPETAATEIGRVLGVPLADIGGVIDFYSMLYREPVGEAVIQVCTDPACALAGGEQTLAELRQRFSSSEARHFTVERAPCLGLCAHAPAVLWGETALEEVFPGQGAEINPSQGSHPQNRVFGSARRLTANCGNGRPTSLDEYLQHGGYAGLRAALSLTPQVVIQRVQDAGLVGRGGAAFPTGVKWAGAAAAAGDQKYIVCNADESEPGTFKDRILLEDDPQRILEGMLIAGYAIGAQRGYIYIRGEYPYAHQVMSEAIHEAHQAGYLGNDLLGSHFNFEVELSRGAGAYICGEESALFESIEGKRGFPRVKPPFPTTYGLFGKPTAINNVETLCNVPLILAQGSAAYRAVGTEKSPGSKLFCVSGDVEQPGLYEVPFGVTLGELIRSEAGGVKGGQPLQAVLLGGAAGAFATHDHLEIPLTFEDLRASGLPLGSGVVMVFNQDRDLRDVLLRLGRFFAHESCGKCYPCQLGTQRQYEILKRGAAGKSLPGDVERLADVGWTMTDASLCGLGQTAASAVLSALKNWPDLFDHDGGA